MTTIIIGKNGNQPFEIKGTGVSKEHAKIIISNDGEWFLEDLNSTNGTYIRNDHGDLVRIGKTIITPMTFISIGPDNSKGCCFYAKQVLNYGNFTEEYEYLNEIEDEYEERLSAVDKKAMQIKKLIFAVNILIVIFSLYGEAGVWILRTGTLVSTFFAAFYDASGAKKKVVLEKQKFNACPNPMCSHGLRTDEIRDMKCKKCNK